MIFLVLVFLFFTPTQSMCKHTYAPFAMALSDINAILSSQLNYAAPALTSTTADICFGCADIKYDQGDFKIVECGDGIYMSLRASDFIMNNKPYNLVAPFWGLLWHFLHQFNLPVWLVEGISNKHAMAISECKKLNIPFVRSFEELENSPLFQTACKKAALQPASLSDYAGIIVFSATPGKERRRSGKKYKEFQKKYPQYIYLNGTARDYLKRKDETYTLFKRAGLSSFIPNFAVFPTNYDNSIVPTVKRLLPKSELVVVKPAFSSLSCGVNVIEKKDLESFLKLILQNPHHIPKSAKRDLAFWKHNKPSRCVISDYARSQTIYKDGKPYDPTMRVMYIMYHDQGVIRVNVLGGFWKIPVYPLHDKSATHTQKHVTIAHAGDYYTGILLEQKESIRMKQAVAPVLAKAYEQMLLERTL
jgi:hypothetical protein